MEKEPKIKLEKEQTLEEIMPILEQAIESQCEIDLTVMDLDGKTSRIATIIPAYIEKDVLWLTTEDGCGMAVELSRIKKAIKLD